MNKTIVAIIIVASIGFSVEARFEKCFKILRNRLTGIEQLEELKPLKDMVDEFCKTNRNCENADGPRSVGFVVHHLMPLRETWREVRRLPEERRKPLIELAEGYLKKYDAILEKSGCTNEEIDYVINHGLEMNKSINQGLSYFSGCFELSRRVLESIYFGTD